MWFLVYFFSFLYKMHLYKWMEGNTITSLGRWLMWCVLTGSGWSTVRRGDGVGGWLKRQIQLPNGDWAFKYCHLVSLLPPHDVHGTRSCGFIQWFRFHKWIDSWWRGFSAASLALVLVTISAISAPCWAGLFSTKFDFGGLTGSRWPFCASRMHFGVPAEACWVVVDGNEVL